MKNSIDGVTGDTRIVNARFFAQFVMLMSMIVFCVSYYAAPPPSCGGNADELKSCEAELNTAQGDMLNAIDDLFTEIESSSALRSSGFSLLRNQAGAQSEINVHLERLKRENVRAKDAIAESTEDDFKEFVEASGKEKGQKCVWEEADDVLSDPDLYVPAGYHTPDSDLGDGVCKSFTALDADDKSVKFNERTLPNVCVRVCADKPANNGGLKKDKYRVRHIERKSESIEATKQSIGSLRASTQRMRVVNAMVESFQTDASNTFALNSIEPFPKCVGSDDAVHIVAFSAKSVLTVAVTVGKITESVLGAVKDLSDDGTEQTAAGFNASTAGIPATVAESIAKGVVALLELSVNAADLVIEGAEIFGTDTAATCAYDIRRAVDGAHTKLDALDTEIQSLKASVGEIGAALNEVQGTVQENQEYIKNTRDIVLTPHGQRKREEVYEP